ncbi:MAG: agenet domain-containing protein [Polyangiaceae bacterium]
MTVRRLLAALGAGMMILVASGAASASRAEIATSDARTPSTASSVEILWGGSWWDGSIVDRRGKSVKVHYTGWGDQWDEWMDASRVRPAGPQGPHAGQVRERVEVSWGGSWWEATVIGRKGAQMKIHYVGWGNEWDEWVEATRVRRARSGRSAH